MKKSAATSDTESFPPILTTSQVAKLGQMSERHVAKLTREGKIPAIRLGRLVRYNRDAVLAALGGE